MGNYPPFFAPMPCPTPVSPLHFLVAWSTWRLSATRIPRSCARNPPRYSPGELGWLCTLHVVDNSKRAKTTTTTIPNVESTSLIAVPFFPQPVIERLERASDRHGRFLPSHSSRGHNSRSLHSHNYWLRPRKEKDCVQSRETENKEYGRLKSAWHSGASKCLGTYIDKAGIDVIRANDSTVRPEFHPSSIICKWSEKEGTVIIMGRATPKTSSVTQGRAHRGADGKLGWEEKRRRGRGGAGRKREGDKRAVFLLSPFSLLPPQPPPFLLPPQFSSAPRFAPGSTRIRKRPQQGRDGVSKYWLTVEIRYAFWPRVS